MIASHISSPKTPAKQYLECFSNHSVAHERESSTHRLVSTRWRRRFMASTRRRCDRLLTSLVAAVSRHRLRKANVQVGVTFTQKCQRQHRMAVSNIGLPLRGTVA